MWNLKKYNKLVNKTKKKQTHRYRKKLMFTSGERKWGRGNIWVEEKKGLLWDYMKSCV